MNESLHNQLETPVLFLIFTRAETAQRVFERIREQKPKYLYVGADGPREDVPADAEKCRRTREILNRIDWDCEVKTLFREKNLGCRNNMAQTISWFFDQVEEGIILEEDCLPDPNFFRYCEELLEYYRNDQRIMHIGGVNFQFGIPRGKGSYYYSQVPHIWGWASWKRAWKYYDVNIPSYREVIEENRRKFFRHAEMNSHFEPIFRSVYADNFDTWDAQWTYTVNAQHGLAVLPNVNLISNIGFAPDALHTKNVGSPYDNIPAGQMEFPLIHPTEMTVDEEADLLTVLQEVASRSIPRWAARSLLKEWLPEFMNSRRILLTAREQIRKRKQADFQER